MSMTLMTHSDVDFLGPTGVLELPTRVPLLRIYCQEKFDMSYDIEHLKVS